MRSGIGRESFLQFADGSLRHHLPNAQTGRKTRKILFINAVNEVTRERAQSFLTEANQAKILDVYRNFADEEDFSRVVLLDEIRAKDGNLNIPLYIRKTVANGNAAQNENSLAEAIAEWEQSSINLRGAMNELFTTLEQNI